MVDRHPHDMTDSGLGREDRVGGLLPQRHRRAEELEAAILLQGAGQQPRFGEHLEPVADADHRAPVGGKGAHRRHHGRETGERARAQVVTVGEAPGQDDRVDVAENAVAVPHDACVDAEPPDRLDHVVLAVRTGEEDHANTRGHGPTATLVASITGLARSRCESASASWRADDSSGASTVKRNALPTCTSWTPSKPSAGSARSMVAPWGSAMPGRRRTSTSTGNLTRSLSHAVPFGKGLSGDALVRGDVALPRRVD